MPIPERDMSKRTEMDLENDALKIPPDARLRLAARLLASVPSATRSSLSEQAALDLAERRARELDTGEKTALDYHDEMKRIRDTLS